MRTSDKLLGVIYAITAVLAMFAAIVIVCSLVRPDDAGAVGVATVMDQSDGPLYDWLC